MSFLDQSLHLMSLPFSDLKSFHSYLQKVGKKIALSEDKVCTFFFFPKNQIAPRVILPFTAPFAATKQFQVLCLLFPLEKPPGTQAITPLLPNEGRNQEWSHQNARFALAFFPWWSSSVLQLFVFLLPERNVNIQAEVFSWELGWDDFCL